MRRERDRADDGEDDDDREDQRGQERASPQRMSPQAQQNGGRAGAGFHMEMFRRVNAEERMTWVVAASPTAVRFTLTEIWMCFTPASLTVLGGIRVLVAV